MPGSELKNAVGFRLVLVCLCLVLLEGCFRRIPAYLLDDEEELPLTPAVLRWFGQLHGELYPELEEVEREGVPLSQFTSRHQLGPFTRERTLWGLKPALEVMEFSDTDHPESDLGAVSAWFLRPGRGPGHQEDQVVAVLLRDFAGAPVLSSPEELLQDLAPAFEANWTLCRPWTDGKEDFIVAHDDRGRKLGLVREAEEPPAWTVDHVEFVAMSVPREQWWRDKGYGGCTTSGTVQQGVFRPATARPFRVGPR